MYSCLHAHVQQAESAAAEAQAAREKEAAEAAAKAKRMAYKPDQTVYGWGCRNR